ncbi:hypothetical protein N7448_002371 [Penicillium atrosanguineum]|uniref:Uncharacterized protein n=1 Tax=Penicillium atrosanguineum TaxID=1132637 RepID=A0A9W9HEA6_9EURO|nr:hypothetical protein N7526_006819 [Penicillium atrosanguineum]KAJ5144979.1 hypothetical protein N7448_002371 [Penicillium atrosanguineum]KAJ5311413.1 hypothetical protein N7476_007273 [Penicillium atrosanguineum]
MTNFATFGPDSFIDTFPAAYAAMEAESKATGAVTMDSSDIWIANPPLSNLILDKSEGPFYDLCISFDILGDEEWSPAGSSISARLQWFTNNADRFPSVFTAAAYLCNAQLLSVFSGARMCTRTSGRIWRFHPSRCWELYSSLSLSASI